MLAIVDHQANGWSRNSKKKRWWTSERARGAKPIIVDDGFVVEREKTEAIIVDYDRLLKKKDKESLGSGI